jgi:subtilisin family serine protease/subtilisin-like proprotein convertase family protein
MHHRPRPSTSLRLERLEDRNLLSAALPTFDDLHLQTARYNAHDVLVAVQPGATLAAVNPAIAAASDSLGNGLFSVTLEPGVSVERGLAYFQAQSWVRYATPDYIVSLARTPNDTSFTSQWGLNNTGQNGGTIGADIHAPAAWNVTTGTGKTIVAIIDTGVDYTHPDLAANMWHNPGEIAGNGKDDDHDGYVDDVYGWNFLANNNNVMDDNGHGTHVAGIIGAVNNGSGVVGVDWNVQIMALKFLDSTGSGNLSNAIRALNYAVAHGAKVSNNSYGGGGYYQAFNDAVAAAARAGHIFVAAAGNDGVNTDVYPQYPADYNLDNIISVAATDRNDRLASFSNYGARTVDLAAPGVSIYSTYKGGGYMTMSGTSMATPFVTGAVALLEDLHPTWGYRQIITQILNNTDPLPSLQGKTVSGGRLDLAKAIGASTGGGGGGGGTTDTRGPSVTSATFSGSTSGSLDKLRVTFSEAINAATFTAADIVSLTRNGVVIAGLTFTVTPVSGTNNQFDIGFTKQTVLGSYALTLGPDIRDLAGNQMNQNGNSINGEAADRYTAIGSVASSQTFYSSDPPKPIADAGTTRSTLTISQGIAINRISVKVNLTHPYDSDLRISLISPAGTKLVLFDRRGGSGQNIGTTFDDRASTAVANGAAPYTGWFKPEQALSALAGQNAKGTWTLLVEDLAAGNVGKLNSWGVTIDGAGTGMARKLDDGAIFLSPPEQKAKSDYLTALDAFPLPSARPADCSRAPDPQVAIPLHAG